MEIIYALVFFLDLLAICGLGFLSFREIDNRGPAWDQALLVIALVLAIVVMVLFIRHYLRRDTGPNDN
ncbi:MAG TPA: hypothetical protein VKQ52_20240 [Puia sp.]|nr:hypothetical protein [Puia sp.]